MGDTPPAAATQGASFDMASFASECEPWDDWDKPAEPFRIYGDTYYVGTCGISAILVANGQFPALIDVGTQKGAETVLRNIQRIGVDPADIRMILTSHEHFDHVGGLPEVLATGARGLIVEESVYDVYYTGMAQPHDPQFGMHEPMRPAKPDGTASNGQLKGITSNSGPPRLFKAIATPGHTPGAMTWQWESCEGDVCKTIVYADSMSPISRDDYRFSDHPDYLAGFRAGIARLRDLDCDILLTPHPSHSKMVERSTTGSFEGGMSCAEYADSKTRALDERLAKEKAGE